MGNIIDYVQTELRRMTDMPFTAADSLALSMLAYIRFAGAVPGKSLFVKTVRLGDLFKAELFGDMFGLMRHPENRRALLFAAAASPRFRDIRMGFYDDHFDAGREQQFSAVTFLLEDDTAFTAFRGTDSTIVGWKEDFNMAYLSPVPSQEAASAYLDAVAKKLPRRMKLRTGGHSKGGNLAIYAAMKCSPALQSRIVSVHNHDGPGFKDSVLDTPEYRAIEKRVTKILPQSSLVGMLLSDREDFSVVESNRSGPMQHDAFSWEMDGDDFVYADKLTSGAVFMHKTLSQWLETLPDDKRQLLVEVLFDIISTTHAETIADITDAWSKSALTMIGSYRNLDPETRKMASQIIRGLLKVSVKNLRSKDGKENIEKAHRQKGVRFSKRKKSVNEINMLE